MRKALFFSINVLFTVGLTSAAISAQSVRVAVEHKREADGFSWIWYALILLQAFVLVFAIYDWRKRRAAAREVEKLNELEKNAKKHDDNERIVIDLGSDVKGQKKKSKPPKKNRNDPEKKPYKALTFKYNSRASDKESKNEIIEPKIPPPIFEIYEIERSRPFSPLLESNDESLLAAIKIIREEFDEDDQTREAAMRTVAAFKNQNAIEAISVVALYDLSSKLRARAVLMLADFDHESVFEYVLLASADSTREVRVAAARAMVRLSFDRREAWQRISDSSDLERLRQYARVMTSYDLVQRLLGRLTHRDKKSAAEALAVVALLIKADETDQIFEFLKNETNPDLQKAILHAIKITGDTKTIERLSSIRESSTFADEVGAEIDSIIEKSTVNLSHILIPPVAPDVLVAEHFVN